MYNLRVDHVLTQNTRLAFSMQLERSNVKWLQCATVPGSAGGASGGRTTFYTLSASSTLRPNLLNEFRAGINRFTVNYDTRFWQRRAACSRAFAASRSSLSSGP
jgi:hypothetical protein